MLERLLLALDRHPRICQAVLVLLLVVAVAQLPKLKIDDSPERWLPANTREAWRALDAHFSFGDSVAIGVEFRRPLRDADIVPLRKLREEVAAIEGMRHAYDSSLIAEDIEGVSLTELLDPANRERFKLYEGAMWGKEQNDHGGRTLLAVGELVYPEDRKELDRLRRNVVQQLSRIIEQAKTLPEFEGVHFHAAGSILLMDELERLASRAVVFLPLSILIGLVSLVLGFRSIPALFLAVGGGGAAMLIVLGFTAWNGHGLGALTMSTPTLISIIAIATTVHFASDAADHGDSSRTRSERDRLIRWVGLPCFGAAFAAAIGFLMLAFNQLGPVRTLGLELFVGSLLAFFCVLIFSQVMPIRRAYSGRILLPERFGRLSDFLGRHSTAVTVATLLVMALFVFLAWPRSPESRLGLKVDADPFSSFFRPDNRLVQAKDHLSEQQFGLYQLDVILVPTQVAPVGSGGKSETTLDEARQAAVQSFSDTLASRKDLGVLSVVSTAAFRERQRQFQEELAKRQRNEGWLATAYNWAFKMPQLYEHLKNFNETFENWNRDKLNQGAIRLTFLAHDRVPDGFKQLMDLAQSTQPAGFDAFFAGTIASVVQLAEGMVYGMWLGLALAALVMMGACVFLFRSVRLMAIAFLPNMFPIVIVYGFMALVGIPITSGSSMVATVALGIALNDTIHFMLHYRKQRYDGGLSLDDSLRETFEHIGRPIILTSIVFIAGFTIFLLSDFLPLFQFGLLATIAMVAALIGDIVLLPCLLRTFDRRGSK